MNAKTVLLTFYACRMPDGMKTFNDDGSPNHDVVETGIDMTKRPPLLNIVFTTNDADLSFSKMCKVMRQSYLRNTDDTTHEAFGKLLDTVRRIYVTANQTRHFVVHEDDDTLIEKSMPFVPHTDEADLEATAMQTIRAGAFVATDTDICMLRLVDATETYHV